MSKLGLNRSVKQSKFMEPPDKRRKVDTADTMWDDDFEQILTQDNLNAIDDIIASQNVGHNRTSLAKSRKTGGSATSCPLPVDSNIVSGAVAGTSNGVFVQEKPSSRIMISESNSSSAAKNSTKFERKHSETGISLKSSSFGPVPLHRSSSTDNGKSSELDLTHPSKDSVTERRGSMKNSAINQSGTGDAVPSSANTGSETISPALPGASAQGPLTDVTRIMEECNFYKTELNKLKESQYAKDGQIKILREKYDQAQTEMNRKNLEIVRILGQKSEEKLKKEAELEAENDKLRTQLQFRQQEVTEIKNQLKRREKLSVDMSSSESSRSPVVGSRTRPKSPKTPTKRPGLSNFPSSQSFLAPNKISSSLSASELVDVTKTATTTVRYQKMKLSLVQPNGNHSGSQLVRHLLQQQLTQSSSSLVGSSTLGSAVGQSSTRSSTQASQKPDIDSAFLSGICNHSATKRNSTLDAALCLAHISLDALLTSRNPTSGISDYSIEDETKPSTLLLPLVEETLKKFVGFLQNQKKSPSSSSNGTLSSGCFCSRNSLESVGLSIGGLSIGGGNSRESEVVYMLVILYQLVTRCEYARAAVIGGTSETPSKDVQMESGFMDAVVSLSIPNIERGCHLMDLLTYLAHPVHTQNRRRCQLIPVLCLSILRILVQSSKEEQVTRFLPLLKSSCLFSCLNFDSDAESNFFLAKRALELLSSAVHLRSVASGLCSFSESCLLLSVISFCSEQKFPSSWTSAAITSIHQQMVAILGVVLRCHFLGCRWLTSTPCECSSKVVKGLLHVICEEYRMLSSSESEASMLVIRQGISILHLLAVNDKTFVTRSLDVGSDNYVTLIAIRKLFKSRSEIPDHEENDFLELLPFSGSSSDEEDMEGVETGHPSKDTPRANGTPPSTSRDA